MIKFVCDLCKKEINGNYGLGFEFKQSTKRGFYIEFSHSVDTTRLLTDKTICSECRQELQEAFREVVNVLNIKIKNLEVKHLLEELPEATNENT